MASQCLFRRKLRLSLTRWCLGAVFTSSAQSCLVIADMRFSGWNQCEGKGGQSSRSGGSSGGSESAEHSGVVDGFGGVVGEFA